MLRKEDFARFFSRRLIDGRQRLKLDRTALSLRVFVALLCGIFLATIVTAGTVTYTYDALGRLTLVTLADGSAVKYNLDAAGNRISVATYPPLTAPTGFTVTPASATSMSLSWLAATGGSGGYTYSVYTSTGTQIVNSLTTTSYTQTGLAIQSPHSYYVVAVDSDTNTSPQSTVASNTTYALPTISSFTGATKSDSTILLSWTAADVSGPGLTAFSLTRTPGTLNASPLSTATSYLDTGLTANTAYTYSLVANDGHGDTVSAPATAGTDPLPSITSFTAVANSSTKNTLTWTATDNAQQGAFTYSVVRGSTSLSCTSSPCPDTGLTANTLYSYTLTATDALNEKATGSASSRTYSLPTATLSLQSVGPTSVTLAWSVGDTSPPGLSSVLITRAGVTKYSGAVTGTSGSGTYTESGLTLGTAYTYSLTSTDTASDVSTASSVTATTRVITDSPVMTEGVDSTGKLVGFQSGTMGSISPTTTSTGFTYKGYYDTYVGGHGGNYASTSFVVSGFTADPSRAWLTSVAGGGESFTGSAATYTYSAGTATWKWTTGGLLSGTGTSTCTVVHN